MVYGAASAAVSFDASAGTGFVGKGDVQLALGWNNKQLNDGAGGVGFTVASVAETTWSCVNEKNEQVQVRTRTTTTQGMITHTARDNKRQITGFNITGYGAVQSVVTDGPAVGSCPADHNLNSKWSLVDGTQSTLPATSTLSVNGVTLP